MMGSMIWRTANAAMPEPTGARTPRRRCNSATNDIGPPNRPGRSLAHRRAPRGTLRRTEGMAEAAWVLRPAPPALAIGYTHRDLGGPSYADGSGPLRAKLIDLPHPGSAQRGAGRERVRPAPFFARAALGSAAAEGPARADVAVAGGHRPGGGEPGERELRLPCHWRTLAKWAGPKRVWG